MKSLLSQSRQTIFWATLIAAPLSWSASCDDTHSVYVYGEMTHLENEWVQYVYSPQTNIGGSLSDWIEHLAPEYTVTEMNSFRNRHTNEPSISLLIYDSQTSIRFQVNLVNGQNLLLSVETSSTALLQAMDIPWNVIAASGPQSWCACGDATCSSINTGIRDNGDFVGAWTLGWD